MEYSALDVLAMGLSVLAVYLIGNKNRYGFLVFMFANVLWIYLGFGEINSVGIAVGNMVFLVLNLRGFVNWKLRSRRKLRERLRARFKSTLCLFYYGEPA